MEWSKIIVPTLINSAIAGLSLITFSDIYKDWRIALGTAGFTFVITFLLELKANIPKTTSTKSGSKSSKNNFFIGGR